MSFPITKDIPGTLRVWASVLDWMQNFINSEKDCPLGVERETGRRWIDGNIIFKKVILIGALPNNSTVTVDHGAVFKTMVSFRGVAQDLTTTGNCVHLPHVDVDSLGTGIEFFLSQTTITIRSLVDYSTYRGYAFLEYTKR